MASSVSILNQVRDDLEAVGQSKLAKRLDRVVKALDENENVMDDNQDNSEEYQDDVESECEICGGPNTTLGNLGGRVHRRCRNCGMMSSENLDRHAGIQTASPLAESPIDISVDSDNQPDLLMPGRWTPEDEIIKTGSKAVHTKIPNYQGSLDMSRNRKAEVAVPAPPLDLENELKYLSPPDEEHSTDVLPEVGHDSAVDDDQQITAAIKIIREVAAGVAGTDKKLSRRIRELGNVLSAEIGPADEGQAGADYSTAGLEESGHDKANDENQTGGVLEFFGTTPPDKAETGPEVKKASKIAFKAETQKTSDSKKTVVAKPNDNSEIKNNLYRKSLQAALSNLTLESVGGDDTELRHAKKLLASLASTTPGPKVSAWETLKTTLIKASKKVQGNRVAGSWSSEVEDYGQVLEVSLSTRNREGAILSPGSVTFSLIKEHPRTKVATVEVADGLISNKSGFNTLTASQAEQFALAWMNRLNQMGNTTLAELSL